MQVENEAQSDVLKARVEEVCERGCGTETMATQACRRVGLCQTRSSNRFFFWRDLSACYFLPSYTSLEFELGPQAKLRFFDRESCFLLIFRLVRHWVNFRLVFVIATPKSEN